MTFEGPLSPLSILMSAFQLFRISVFGMVPWSVIFWSRFLVVPYFCIPILRFPWPVKPSLSSFHWADFRGTCGAGKSTLMKGGHVSDGRARTQGSGFMNLPVQVGQSIVSG